MLTTHYVHLGCQLSHFPLPNNTAIEPRSFQEGVETLGGDRKENEIQCISYIYYYSVNFKGVTEKEVECISSFIVIVAVVCNKKQLEKVRV